VAATFASAGSNATIALGLSYTIITALAFLLIESARAEARQSSAGSVIYSANGLLTQPKHPSDSGASVLLAVGRDAAVAATLCTAFASATLESFSFGGLAYRGSFGQVMGEEWKAWDETLELVYAMGVLLVQLITNGLLLYMVSTHENTLMKYRADMSKCIGPTTRTVPYELRTTVCLDLITTFRQLFSRPALVCHIMWRFVIHFSRSAGSFSRWPS
jgi:hypothetical protein